MEQLFILFNGIRRMSPELVVHLRSILKHIHFKKGEYILKKGRICYNIYFIEKGLVRISHDFGGREVTSFFLIEKDIFISVKSFFRQAPSNEYIIAEEDCSCWYISHEQLVETCRLFPEFFEHRVWITEEYYCRSIDRHNDMQYKSAQERYDQFAEQHPGLLQRVPINLIPSYLDVAPSTIHGIRSNYTNRRK